MKNGKAEGYYKNGKLKFKGELINNIKNGRAKEYYSHNIIDYYMLKYWLSKILIFLLLIIIYYYL